MNINSVCGVSKPGAEVEEGRLNCKYTDGLSHNVLVHNFITRGGAPSYTQHNTYLEEASFPKELLAQSHLELESPQSPPRQRL